MQRTDGTYDLPDASVSLVWQSEQGQVVRYNTHELWQGWKVMTGECVNLKPGRWLPWQPPTFPVRKKTELRRAKVRVDGTDTIAVRRDGKTDCPWTMVAVGDYWACRKDSSVTILEWLDPEYEDEV